MLVIQSKKQIITQKISEIENKGTNHNHDKYITTPEFNKFTSEILATKLPNLVTKTDFETKLISLNRKINSNKTKHSLFENEFKKLQLFDSIYFRGKSYFKEDGAQSYLIFQPVYRHFKKISGVGYSITPQLSYYSSKIRVKFNGSCFKQDKITYTHGTIVNIQLFLRQVKI